MDILTFYDVVRKMNQNISLIFSKLISFPECILNDLIQSPDKHLLSKSNIAVDNLADSSPILSSKFINAKK